jgi:hypothetical protein
VSRRHCCSRFGARSRSEGLPTHRSRPYVARAGLMSG